MKRVVFLFVLLFFSCQAYGIYFQIIQLDSKDDRDVKSLCSIDGFTQANIEYIIEFLKDPFIVRKISGKVQLEDGTPFPGVIFEIRKKDVNWKSQTIHKVYSDKNGSFSFKHIKHGIYCFKTTLDGFQSVMGEISVSTKAMKNSSIVIKMKPGV
jgi:hypothetical protein